MSTTPEQQLYGQQEEARGFTPVHIAKAVVGTVVIALLLSFVYGPIDYYSPIVYLNIVLAYGMGWAVGRCGCSMLRRLRIDSRKAATIVGAAGGIVAVWFSWLTYLWVAFGYNFEVFSAFANPFHLFDIMRYIGENPIWSIGTRSGRSSSAGPSIMYYAVWLAEVGIIVYFAVKECRTFVENNKLCGRCKDWVRPTGETALFAIPEDVDVFGPLQAGDLAGLPSLPRLTGDEVGEHWLEASCFACGNCESLNAHVTVALKAIKLDKNKKPQIVSTVLANLVEVTPELEKEIFEPAPQAQTPEATTPPPLPDGGPVTDDDADSEGEEEK